MNILLVDDEPVLVESIRIGLENRGYVVIEANSARKAMDLLHRGGHIIDLVITDYIMPAMNGMDLLAAIRRNRPTLPVMIMTAYADTSLVIEAMKNHCNAFIEKPFTPGELISEIERIKLHLLRNTPSNDLRQLLPRLVHQINNPLLAISGFAELIKLNWGDGDVFKKYAEKILDAVEQIGHINKDIINAGLMEEGRFAPVDLDTLLDHCLEMFHGLFILKNIQVDKQISMDGIRVVGDQFGLEQVFKNLFLNAADAMDDMPEKKLNLTVTPRWDLASVEIIVKDTGCGIQKELLLKIFEPYFTNKRDGNGLGLEITKNIVEKHGGKVIVESNVGIGSTFTVHLPAIQMERDEKCFNWVMEK
jgi:signal transduction histidine kinase